MTQRVKLTGPRSFSSYDTFEYCLSFLFHGQRQVSIQITMIDDNEAILGLENFRESEFDFTSSTC